MKWRSRSLSLSLFPLDSTILCLKCVAIGCVAREARQQFGKGTMEDPLRHAVGMRTAQDQYKMQMWNSFPSLFQNTIFHGEQALAGACTCWKMLEVQPALTRAAWC